MRKYLAGSLLAISVLVAVILFYVLIVLKGDPEEKLELSSTTSTTEGTNTTIEAESFVGNWTIDSANSEAGYRVIEELRGIPDFEATGRTKELEGSLTITEEELSAVAVTVDLANMDSGEANRDKAFKRVLGVSEFPTATFTLTQPIPLSPGIKSLETQATGELTLNGVTKPVQALLQAQVNNDLNIEIVGDIEITFEEYNIENPSNPIAKVGDTGLVEFRIVFVRQ